jgi:hypothetical protein
LTGRQEDRKTGRQEDRKTGRQEDRKTGRQEKMLLIFPSSCLPIFAFWVYGITVGEATEKLV